MSKGKVNKERAEMAELLADYLCDHFCNGSGYSTCLERNVPAILSLNTKTNRLAIVRKKPRYPKCRSAVVIDGEIYENEQVELASFITQKEMLNAGFVQEELND